MKFYTGIGSRNTPDDVLQKMKLYGYVFAELGLSLRSGAADGADAAFEAGCDRALGPKEIYLPWRRFNGHPSPHFQITDTAMEVAADAYGDGWDYLKPPVKKLMTRNCYQVAGFTLDTPSEFVLCWTPDGACRRAERGRKTGGTGQAIAYASVHNVPVFNLQRDGSEEKLMKFLQNNFKQDWVDVDNNEYGQRWSDLIS